MLAWPRSKRGRLGVTLLAAAALLWATAGLWLPWLGTSMVWDEPLQKADAIVVLAGNAPLRMEHGVELYQAGWAPLLIVSDETLRTNGMEVTWDQIFNAGVVLPNVPRDAVVPMDPPPQDTREEARRSAAILKERGLHSAILVTDPFHSRRATLLFRAAYRKQGLEVRSSPGVDDRDLPHWWQTARSVRTVLEEYTKTIWYVVRGAYF
jgi:uncharacterized SAM-binding protein YcdF (DUF218 family)